ncbi:unnamed protein product [Sphagnum tenellum]
MIAEGENSRVLPNTRSSTEALPGLHLDICTAAPNPVNTHPQMARNESKLSYKEPVLPLRLVLCCLEYAWVTTRRMTNCSSCQYVGMFSTKIVSMNGLQTIQPAQSVDLCLFPVAKWVQWYHQPESVACILALPGSSLFYMLQEVQVHSKPGLEGTGICNLI